MAGAGGEPRVWAVLGFVGVCAVARLPPPPPLLLPPLPPPPLAERFFFFFWFAGSAILKRTGIRGCGSWSPPPPEPQPPCTRPVWASAAQASRIAQLTGLAGGGCFYPVLRWAPGARGKPQQSEQERGQRRRPVVKPPLREEEQEEVTREKRTARSPSALRKSLSPGEKWGRGPPPAEGGEGGGGRGHLCCKAGAASSEFGGPVQLGPPTVCLDTLCRPSPLGLGCTQGRPYPGTEPWLSPPRVLLLKRRRLCCAVSSQQRRDNALFRGQQLDRGKEGREG